MSLVTRGRLGLALCQILLGLSVVGVPASALAFDFFGLFGSEKPPVPVAGAAVYEVTFAAGDNSSVTRSLRDVSGLFRLRKDAPPDGATLAQRAANDLVPMIDAMWALGYYDGAVTIDIAGAPVQLPVTEASISAAARAANADIGVRVVPVKVVATPGTRYKLGSIEVVDHHGGRPFTAEELPLRVLKLEQGAPAASVTLRAAEANLVDYFREQSYPLAKAVDIKASVNHRTQTMDVVFVVDKGPKAPIGDVSLSGTENVDPAVVRSFIYLEPGDPYSPKALNSTRRSVAGIPIIGSVRVSAADHLDATGRVPVFVTVAERKPRVVGFFAGFSTTDGPVVRSYWEHRNLFGGAEQLRLEASMFTAPRNNGTRLTNFKDMEMSDLGGRFKATFIKPALGGSRNDLIVETMAERDRTGGDRYGGYTVRDVRGTVSLRHRISDTFSIQAGLTAERGRTSDVLGDVDYFIAGVPISLMYDSTDNTLDPTRGFKVVASVTPYPTFMGSTVGFTEGRVQASTYLALDEEARYVLAGRVTLGAMDGPGLADIPANHRFFAGGAASVRGYRRNSLGPTGPFGFVVGGRSLLELSLEARIKITDNIGIVPFFDAGNAFEDSTPNINDKLYKAAGIGLRYYTPIGPIRADFAFPIDRRPGDKPVSMYLSIGQSF